MMEQTGNAPRGTTMPVRPTNADPEAGASTDKMLVRMREINDEIMALTEEKSNLTEQVQKRLGALGQDLEVAAANPLGHF
jgi:hypothetical protein